MFQVPSHWFEYYARTPSVIEKWARHHISGERVPSELLRTALASARMFPAIDLHNQILYSAVDQVRVFSFFRRRGSGFFVLAFISLCLFTILFHNLFFIIPCYVLLFYVYFVIFFVVVVHVWHGDWRHFFTLTG
mgnify:CR=1 FL=1